MSPSKTVLVTTPMFGRYSDSSVEILSEFGCDFIELSRDEAADRDTLYTHLDGVAAWIVGYTEIDSDTFDHASSLEVIAKHGTGVDNIALSVANERGVVVANAPGANANAVAELVILLLLNYCRRLVTADQAVRDGEWGSEIGREISGKTLGIIGLGTIGQTLVKRTQGFDITYLAFDVADRSAFTAEYDVTHTDDLQTVLAKSDFVTVHVPLTDHTTHLIGIDEFRAMNSSACIINTARGGVINEDALLWALETNEIGGAALDVFEREPPIGTDRYDTLFDDSRLTVSPHIGGKTEEAMAKISEITAQNIVNVFEGRDPVHRVI